MSLGCRGTTSCGIGRVGICVGAAGGNCKWDYGDRMYGRVSEGGPTGKLAVHHCSLTAVYLGLGIGMGIAMQITSHSVAYSVQV